MNITDPIRRHAQQSPEALAVVRAGDVVTYRELDRVIDALAARLAGLGLGAGDAAGVMVSGRYGRLALTLALARIGAAAATVRKPAKSLGGVALKTCFVDASISSNAVAGCIKVDREWWRIPAATQRVPPVPPHPDGGAICLIVTSSGTTGTAKALALSHDIMCTRLRARSAVLPIPERPRQLCMLGLGTHYGMAGVLQALWSGGLVTMAFNGSLHGAIQLYQLNYLVMSPAQLHGLLDQLPEGAGPFPSLEVVEIGGSLIPARLARLARKRLCANTWVAYGASETGNVAVASLAALENNPGAAGFVTAGVEVEAVDADARPLPAGVEGTIRIRGENCIGAYLGDAAASAMAFRDGWFYPGDVGSVSGKGLLTIAGRTDELINAGGLKVSPQVIEDVVLMNPDVSEAAAFAAPNAATGMQEIWIAIVQSRPVDTAALCAFCVERLGPAGAPTSVLVVEALPRNRNGKVLRDQLVKAADAKSKTPVMKKARPPLLH